MDRYRKFFVAAVGAGVVILNQFVGIDVAGPEVAEWVTIITAGLTAAGVYRVPNRAD